MGLGIVTEAGDEGSVDLQLIHRKLVEMAERGVAGAEVVDGDANAERLQLLERGSHCRLIGHDHRFGDLEREQRGLKPAQVQGSGYIVHDLGVSQLPSRDVDVHGETGGRRVMLLPESSLAARCPRRPSDRSARSLRSSRRSG